MYRVVKEFTDLKDSNHKYAMGDEFPRSGLIVDQKRIDELNGVNNRLGYAVIKEVAEPVNDETEVFRAKDKKRKKNAVRDLS